MAPRLKSSAGASSIGSAVRDAARGVSGRKSAPTRRREEEAAVGARLKAIAQRHREELKAEAVRRGIEVRAPRKGRDRVIGQVTRTAVGIHMDDVEVQLVASAFQEVRVGASAFLIAVVDAITARDLDAVADAIVAFDAHVASQQYLCSKIVTVRLWDQAGSAVYGPTRTPKTSPRTGSPATSTVVAALHRPLRPRGLPMDQAAFCSALRDGIAIKLDTKWHDVAFAKLTKQGRVGYLDGRRKPIADAGSIDLTTLLRKARTGGVIARTRPWGRKMPRASP